MAAPTTNLPREWSSLVGRGSEIDHTEALLLTGGGVVTLTGPGGVGKTRLARTRPELGEWAQTALRLPGAPQHSLFSAVHGSAALAAQLRGQFAETRRLA
jgi:ABC-type uncharacterized transport system fused permease/ATPase subunit